MTANYQQIIELVNELVPYIAFSISIIGIVFTWLNYKFSIDQSKFKAELYVGFNFKSTDINDKNKYMSFIIYNKGMRDIFFSWPCISFKYLSNNTDFVFVNSPFPSQHTPFILKSGQSKKIQCINDLKPSEIKEIRYIYMFDELNNKYIFKVAKWYKRFFYSVKRNINKPRKK